MDTCYLNTSVLKLDTGLHDPSFGSGVVIIDLEDAVHVAHKQAARATLAALDLSGPSARAVRFGVRINSLMGLDGLRDLSVLADWVRARHLQSGASPISFVQLPKVESRFELDLCRAALRDLPQMPEVIPIIETPGGVARLDEIAAASDAMMFGRVDMSASMYRANRSWLAYARGAFCVACARYAIPAIDTAGFGNVADIKDSAAFEADCLDGRAEGFTARAVVHPAQVPVVKRVFAMDPDELRGYRMTIAAYDEADTGFSVSNGNIVAPPFVARARKMLRVYGAARGGAA